jgi:hypothetical protein
MELISVSQIKNEWDIMELADTLRGKCNHVNVLLRQYKAPPITATIRDPHIEERLDDYITYLNNALVIIHTKIQLSIKEKYKPEKKKALNPSAALYVPPHKR